MAYTTIKKPNLYFTPFTFTGSGSAGTRTGVGFTPDMFIHKNRDNNQGWGVIDVIRGNGNYLSTNTANAELSDVGAYGITTDGYTFPNGDIFFNGSGSNMAYWNWKAGGAGVSNTDGSISSTVSANTTSGFSIVSFTGTGSTATVGHGLGVTPKMFIVKNRSIAETWRPYHVALGGGQALALNGTNATDTDASYWSNTNPTSSVFTVGTNSGTNGSGNNMIAYCFAEKKGFSKIGSYTGNGNADGPFVYTGFKPAFILGKAASGTSAAFENWFIYDVKRNTFNPTYNVLFPNSGSAEGTNSAQSLDLLSNGFKARSVETRFNESGSTYIYMAFAEEPLVGDNPATAR